MDTTAHSKNNSIIRFHNELNDFLPENKKDIEFTHNFFLHPSVKDLIESLNVPHVEVDLIKINGNYYDFSHNIKNGDRIEVFPGSYKSSAYKKSERDKGIINLLPDSPVIINFILDVHLGKLARNLRLLGFDCLYQNNYSDEEIITITDKTQRIVISRDICILKNFRVKYGYWPRSEDHLQQTGEILSHFQVTGQIQPFSRCTICNSPLHIVPKDKIRTMLEPETEQYFNEFFQCGNCNKIYWKGSHYDRMKEWMDKLLESL